MGGASFASAELTEASLDDRPAVQVGDPFLEKGLIEELESFSPITDYTGKLELHFIGSEYRLKRPRHDVEEAKRRDAELEKIAKNAAPAGDADPYVKPKTSEE